MTDIILESERLLIRPLNINELICIKNNRADKLVTHILPGALSEAVLLAIKKKIVIPLNSDDVFLYQFYMAFSNQFQ